MSKIPVLILFVFVFGFSNSVYAQDAQAKTDELVAALAKTKYKKKEKKNIKVEVYVDIKSEPVVKADAREYAGVYEGENGSRLELRVAAGGQVEGSGYDGEYDDSGKRSFTLQNARIEGALLTATKVYEGGEAVRFEALFNNWTVTTGKNPSRIENRETRYGIGFIETRGDWKSRVFLEFK